MAQSLRWAAPISVWVQKSSLNFEGFCFMSSYLIRHIMPSLCPVRISRWPQDKIIMDRFRKTLDREECIPPPPVSALRYESGIWKWKKKKNCCPNEISELHSEWEGIKDEIQNWLLAGGKRNQKLTSILISSILQAYTFMQSRTLKVFREPLLGRNGWPADWERVERKRENSNGILFLNDLFKP